MKNPYRLEDHPPYARLRARVDELKAQLHGGGVKDLESLRLEASQAEEAAVELEVTAVIDPAQGAKAKAARKKADELSARLSAAEGQARILTAALERLAPELAAAKLEATEAIYRKARVEHEKAAQRIVTALQELAAACDGEIAIRVAVGQAIGAYPSDGYLLPICPPGRTGPHPGHENDFRSTFYFTVRALRSAGYPV